MKKIPIIIVFLLFFAVVFTANLFAETIVLNSGKVVEADIVELTRDAIKVNLKGDEVTYDLDQIKSIGAEKDSTFSKKYLKEESLKKNLSKDVDKKQRKLKGVEQIQDLLEKNRKELRLKKKEYIQAKKDLKKNARTGFLGFGRTKEEIQSLRKAKNEVTKLKKEYNNIKQNIKKLRKELNLAREIKILQKKQRQISNSF
ncbi:MAG: hypothetical protein R6U54_01230 [Candidatus Omnitrophota bacterium]